MSHKLRIVLAQLNLLVGDIQGNLDKMINAAKLARDTLSADIIVFPELSITGYPPEDLLFRKSFIDAATAALYEFKLQVSGIYCVVGHPYHTPQGLFNACSLIYNNNSLGTCCKQNLPNYDVFDEQRYFIPGNANAPCVFPVQGIPIGFLICEDIWSDPPIKQAAAQGARLIISPNASPFEIHKQEKRQLALSKLAKNTDLPIFYVNCVGGQDELVFDGGSMVVDQGGNICLHAGFFKEELLSIEIDVTSTELTIKSVPFAIPDVDARVYQALVLGVRDYVRINNFSGAIIGVSGGIDSALSLAIATDALGKDNVSAIFMPSRYTAEMSQEDALALVTNLGVYFEIISIEPAYNAFLESLAPLLSGKKSDVTTENLQSRTRAVILMAISNKTGRIVLTTGNRSELAVGYTTLYGDMSGGFCVLKDVPKTWVYRLAHYRNQVSAVIPERTINRPPTAELYFDQKDEDTLPPYSILDTILEQYINQEQSIDEIVAEGFDHETVTRVVTLIKKNEYKRRQSPIGIRINRKAFGRDRRYPISSGYLE